MRKQNLIFSALIACTLFWGTATWACSGMGPDTHVGLVTGVDTQGGTFTILDAETRQPITFSASSEVLERVSKTKLQIKVTYEKKGGELVAADVVI